jgi:CRP-like cAMP-binding protein
MIYGRHNVKSSSWDDSTYHVGWQFLIDCSVHESYFDQNTHVLTVPMSRYDIADYLGTSAETVTRAFTRLERDGLLRRVTARTVELKPELLKVFVNFE